MVKNKLEGKDKLTPWEQFLEKKKEKKTLKKKQKALAEEASEDDVPSDVDMNDPYFAEEAKKIGKPTHICNLPLESKAKKVTWVETM